MREYFCAYHSLLESLTPYSDAECGRLFRACLVYSMTGKEEEFRGNERFIWPTMKQMIDRDISSYDTKVENGRKGGRKSKSTLDPVSEKNRNQFRFPNETEPNQEKEKEEEKEEPKKESPVGDSKESAPTLEQVRAYVQEHGYIVDAVKFFTHYSANGWAIGGKPILDWRRLLDKWEVEDRGRANKHPVSGVRGSPPPEGGREWNVHYDV